VDVHDNGHTQVRVRRGDSVKVEAQGKIAPVKSGESVTVEPGLAPSAPSAVRRGDDAALAVPEPLKPAADAKLSVKPDAAGQCTARLSWKPVPAALGYLLEVRAANGTVSKVKSPGPTVTVQSLAPGVYVWKVRAVGQYGASEPSVERAFELLASPLKLEVKGSSWK
jgi:hypothetical protein